MKRKSIIVLMLVLAIIFNGFGDIVYAKSEIPDPDEYDVVVELKREAYTYTGKTITPKPIVYLDMISDGEQIKLSAKDYKVEYDKGRKQIGKYFVKVTLKEPYSGSARISFTIVPKKPTISSVTSTEKNITLKWKKVTNVNGYKIQYSTDEDFVVSKTIMVENNGTFVKKLGNVKQGKDYYVKICSYKKKDGKKYYSDWSKIKKVKVKVPTTQATTQARTETPAPSPSGGDSEYVWIPQSGSKYHKYSTCSGMKNPRQVTKDEAISRGYTPCSKCY